MWRAQKFPRQQNFWSTQINHDKSMHNAKFKHKIWKSKTIWNVQDVGSNETLLLKHGLIFIFFNGARSYSKLIQTTNSNNSNN